jgi:PAS domain S-box-containing protein
MPETSNSQDEHVAQLLHSLVEQAQEHAFILLTPNGEIMWCNHGAERLFLSERATLAGRHIHEIFTDRDQAAGIDWLERAVASADAVSEDDRWHLRVDGTRFWSSGALIPIKDRAGQLLAFGKIIRDRTDQKTQLNLLANQLESAQRLDAEKDRAIIKLSHELRNVIAGVRGAVELLDRPLDKPERRSKFGELMHKQLAIIERLTQDLLDVKRAASGKIALNFERLVVQNELHDLIQGVERRLRDARVSVQLLTPPADIIVEADRIRLQQILGNILDNAIKYTPAGGKIWVKAKPEDRHAVIHVEDTGRGIPSDMLSNIFELFTQVDAHTSAGGLGVGLALVRELVLLHGGSVQATSKGPGQGSEFSVRLPLKAVGAAAVDTGMIDIGAIEIGQSTVARSAPGQ